MPRMLLVEEHLDAEDARNPEEGTLIAAIEECRHLYEVLPERSLVPLFRAFARPGAEVRRWIFDLAGLTPPISDYVARTVVQGADAIVHGRSQSMSDDAELTPERKKLARMLAFAMRNPAFAHVGRGRPNKTDAALVLWVIRVTEDALGREFTFGRSYKRGMKAEGPMMRLVQAGLRCLMRHLDTPEMRILMRPDSPDAMLASYGPETIASVARMMRAKAFKAEFPERPAAAFILANRHTMRGVLAGC